MLAGIPVPGCTIRLPKLERIDADFVGELVHRAFEHRHAVRRPRRPHVARRRLVELGELVGELDVVAMVHQAGPVHESFLVVFVLRSCSNSVMHDGQQLALAVGRQRHRMKRVGPVSDVEHLCAREGDPDRPFQCKACHHGQEHLRLRAQC